MTDNYSKNNKANYGMTKSKVLTRKMGITIFMATEKPLAGIMLGVT